MNKSKIITILIFISIIASSLYFGLPRLRNFSGVDEPYWSYGRVPKFWDSVMAQKWKGTNLCDKPGITLAIVSGAGLPFIDAHPKDYKKFRYAPKTIEQLNFIRDIYYKLRFPVFIFTLLTLPAFYFLIKKLLGKNTARFSLIFIGLSPVLLGISLIINSDSMLWILTALSTLGLFNFLKHQQKKYLLLAGFLLGLSVITKYVANILFIYFFAIFILEYILHAHTKMEIGKYLKNAFINYMILLGVAILTAFAFFPATWVKFSVLVNATIGNDVFKSVWPIFIGSIAFFGIDIFVLKSRISEKIFGSAVKHKTLIIRGLGIIFLALAVLILFHAYTPLQIYDIQKIIASPKGIGQGNVLQRYGGAVSADLYSLLFSVSPLVLAAILFSVSGILKKKAVFERDAITATYILIFILIFYLGSAVNGVITTVRYQIMTYPLAFVLAAIGMNRFLTLERIRKILPTSVAYAVAMVILLASLWNIKPYFLAYASEILPKNQIVNLKGMGEGSIEAANYLNSLPNANKMTIWSDKGAVCEAFVGKCYIDFKKKTFQENKFDYFVLSTDRKSRSLKMSGGSVEYANFTELYASNDTEFEVIIGEREINFVKVIKAEQ